MLYQVKLALINMEVVTLCESNSFAEAKRSYLSALARPDGRLVWMMCRDEMINQDCCGSDAKSVRVRPFGLSGVGLSGFDS